MANYVFNSITITGKPEHLQAFQEQARFEEREFSYWNFVTPPKEALDSGEYWETNGWKDGERYGNTHNNWYNFNCREWGTKWDSVDVEPIWVKEELKDTLIGWTWQSPWSPPTPVFKAIVAQNPELAFEFDWEEEQGWGGRAVGVAGEFIITKEWDIPDAHDDYVNLGWEDRCQCESEDDSEYWYDDCPRKIALLASDPSEENE